MKLGRSRIGVALAAAGLAACTSLSKDAEELCRVAGVIEAKPGISAEKKFFEVLARLEGRRGTTDFQYILAAVAGAAPELRSELVRVGFAEAGLADWTCQPFERISSGKERLAILPGHLTLNGRPIAADLAQTGACDRVLPHLLEALRPLAAGALRSMPALDVQVDPGVPFCTISRLARTCWEAGFPRMQLGQIIVARSTPLRADGPKMTFGLTLAVGRRGMLIAGRGGVLAGTGGSPWSVGCKAGGQGLCDDGDRGSYDYAALIDTLSKVRKTFPGERSIAVTADDVVPFRLLVRGLAAVQGERGSLFPHIALVTAEEANTRLGYEALRKVGGSLEPGAARPVRSRARKRVD